MNLSCAETIHGAVLANPEAAAALVPAIDLAAENFARYFTTPTQPISIVAIGNVPIETTDALRKAGFLPLPWFDGSMRNNLKESLRKQIAEQTPLTGAQLDQAVERAMQQLPVGSLNNAKAGAVETGALAHEVGHYWFHVLYDGSQANVSRTHYGSSADDWLDETAAVLMENEEITKGRRAALGSRPAIFSLTEFLTEPHPMTNKGNAPGPATGPGKESQPVFGARVMIVRREESEKTPNTNRKDGPAFYALARSFADFMLERSSNPKIIHDIAIALRKGQDIRSWVAQNGKRLGIGTTVAEVEKAWNTWRGAAN